MIRRSGPGLLDRRRLIGCALGASAAWAAPARGEGGAVGVRVLVDGPRRPISPYVYGSSEVGTLDSPTPSSLLDRAAGVTARRFGGNLTTTYNWTNNASNAGKDWLHANGDLMGRLIGLPEALRREPAAVIAQMHQASLDMGAISLVTLPLAGYVAADFDGPVSEAQAAPSPRFVPVLWDSARAASAPVDPSVADIPHLLRRLRERYGPADGATGIRGYALDNEPGLWALTHPRIVRRPTRIADLLARAVKAARVIKAIDPTAWVVGPASWGATELATFQDAPDWGDYRHHGNFVAAYLAAFRNASEAAGLRLLDALDVHWYPYSAHGDLYGTSDPALARFLLDAPRTLTESGFREESWVSRALPVSDANILALPILPSLERIVARELPGARIAVTEFNYGAPGQLASGLALADVLGRLGRPSILMAMHWGGLDGWLGQAYRLYRDYDGAGGRFGQTGLDVALSDPASASAHAALGAAGRLHVVVINKATRPLPVDLALGAERPGATITEYGFDAEHPITGLIAASRPAGPVARVTLPPRAARHYVVERG